MVATLKENGNTKYSNDLGQMPNMWKNKIIHTLWKYKMVRH